MSGSGTGDDSVFVDHGGRVVESLRDVILGEFWVLVEDLVALQAAGDHPEEVPQLLDELGELPVLPNDDSVVVILEAQDRDRAEEILGDS